MRSSNLAVLLAGVVAARAFPGKIVERDDKWVIGQSVKTTSGEVSGHEAEWPPNAGVSEYLGIPFAEPPVGELRFEKPKRFKSDKKISGSKFGPDCAQFTKELFPYMNNIPKINGLDEGLINWGKALVGAPNTTFEEDCLYLNVWTKPQTGEKKKAVMVWIYGGAFSLGASSAPFYSVARYAAEQDIVAVSINYRLSLFGFPLATFLKDQNLGLWDQRAAVEWVRDNIEAFGGDPKRITIFGESAGAASVDYYSYAWKDDPIVHGLISQSGTATGLIGDPPNSLAWNVVSKTVGCPLNAPGIPCMKKKSTDEILRGIGQVGIANITLMSFWPVNDNVTVFSDILHREERGDFAKIPYLVGNNDVEGALITGFMMVVANVIKENANILGANANSVISLVNNTVDYFANSTGFVVDSIRGFLGFIQDGIFNCPANTAANARYKAKVPVWRYRYYGRFDNMAIGGQGAYHVSEVPMVMGTVERKGGPKNTPAQAELSKNMMTAWATFAKDPQEGLTKLGWPKYEPEKNTLIRLGYQNSPKIDFAKGIEHDASCPKFVIPPSAPLHS